MCLCCCFAVEDVVGGVRHVGPSAADGVLVVGVAFDHVVTEDVQHIIERLGQLFSFDEGGAVSVRHVCFEEAELCVGVTEGASVYASNWEGDGVAMNWFKSRANV